jgi:hypothetical protein
MTTSVGAAFELLISYWVFGLIWMILGGILYVLGPVAPAGPVTDFAWMIWAAVIIIYLFFGALYFWGQIRTWLIQR